MNTSSQKGMYYHCPRCRKWISAERTRCDCGQFLSGQIPQPMPAEEQTAGGNGRGRQGAEGQGIRLSGEGRAVRQSKTAGQAFRMRCSGCGQICQTASRECPVCGGILLPLPQEMSAPQAGSCASLADGSPFILPQEMSAPQAGAVRQEAEARQRAVQPPEADPWQGAMMQADSFLEEEEAFSGTETEAVRWNDEEEEELLEAPEPLYYFTAKRYENGKPVQAKVINIPIGPEGLVLGRIAFTTDSRLFFGSGSRQIDARYAGISRYNVVIQEQDERLYIGYCRDSGQKSMVYVNQEGLKRDEVREIFGGDVIRFGGRNESDKTIDVQISRRGEENLPVQSAEMTSNKVQWNILQDFMEEIRQKTSETYQGVVLANASLTQIQGDLQLINGAVAAIQPADLSMRENEDKEDYENRLADQVPEVAPTTREEYISRFLKSVLEEGSETYRRKLEFFNARERRGHLLYQAAFYENACETIGLGDYAGPMSFLGKAVEGFVMGEVARVVEVFNHDAYAGLDRERSGRLNQNDILALCRKNGAKMRILQAAGFGRNTTFARRMDEALDVLHEVRKARNDASHCDPDTEEPTDGVVEEITRERYMEIKRLLFTSEALETMHALYLRTPQVGRR